MIFQILWCANLFSVQALWDLSASVVAFWLRQFHHRDTEFHRVPQRFRKLGDNRKSVFGHADGVVHERVIDSSYDETGADDAMVAKAFSCTRVGEASASQVVGQTPHRVH